MPNKHVEFSHSESKLHLGHWHHRWIFTLTDPESRLVAKFPFAIVEPTSLADRRNELAFIWGRELRFCILNDDFAGRTTYNTATLYRLRVGL
jgi:hypothetical protein